MHLANVGVQAAQFLERAAAVHALEEWLVFILKEDKKLLFPGTGQAPKGSEFSEGKYLFQE